MPRRLRFAWATSHYRLGRDDGYRIRIAVECAEDMPEEVFAYRLQDVNPTTGAKAGTFSHVCSPVDLAEYPAGAPRVGELPEWFRLSYVDVLVRSITEAEAFIRDVRSDLRRLKRSLDVLDAVSPMGHEDVGGVGPCASSSATLPPTPLSSSSASIEYGPVTRRRHVGGLARGVGRGARWAAVGDGAGSEVGASDSLDGQTSYAKSRVIVGNEPVSQMLLLQGFDIDLPAAALLVGIEARLYVRDATTSPASSASLSPASVHDPRLFYFRLYHPERGAVGDERSGNTALFGPTWQVLTMGGPADDWNAGLTVADVNRGDFGVALLVGASGAPTETVIEVDGVELEISYQVPA